MAKKEFVYTVCDAEEDARRTAPEKKGLRLYKIEDPNDAKDGFVMAPNIGEATIAYTSQRLGLRVGLNKAVKEKKARTRKPKAEDILNEFATSPSPEVQSLIEKLRATVAKRKAITEETPEAAPVAGPGDAPVDEVPPPPPPA